MRGRTVGGFRNFLSDFTPSRLCNVPETFASREAGRYLAALELLAEYRNSKDMLDFAVKWLYANQSEEGFWDMGSGVKDGIYFPLSDNWKKKENRIADCTWRILRLLGKLEDRNKESEIGTQELRIRN